MNINCKQTRRPRQRGTAVLLMLCLMAILMLFVASNIRTLLQLKQELRLVERKQIRRLETKSAGGNQDQTGRTNALPRTTTITQTEQASGQPPPK